jgi:hypothetical protein
MVPEDISQCLVEVLGQQRVDGGAAKHARRGHVTSDWYVVVHEDGNSQGGGLIGRGGLMMLHRIAF